MEWLELWMSVHCGQQRVLTSSLDTQMLLLKRDLFNQGRERESLMTTPSLFDFFRVCKWVYRISVGNILIMAILTHIGAFMCLVWSALLFPSEEGFCKSSNIQPHFLIWIVSVWIRIEYWLLNNDYYFTEKLQEPLKFIQVIVEFEMSFRSYTVDLAFF